MIEHCPDPYPDEVLYSVWARYSDHVQNPHKDDVFQELFGNRKVKATVDLPCHLDYFVNNLPIGHSYTIDFFIDHHTLFPFYGPFLPQERYRRLREQMRTGNGQAIHMRAGIIGSDTLPPQWLRYCPQCVEQDRTSFGECYWHRLHQAPGVEICPIHKAFLENSTVQARNSFATNEFVSAERALKPAERRSAESSPFFKTLMDIADDVHYLLMRPRTPPMAHFFGEQYRALLALHGFMTPRGFVRVVDLLTTFVSHYSAELLALLHCEMTQSRLDSTWLAVLAHQSKSVQHPLRHILAIRFLGSTVEEFFHQHTMPYKPFGNGPWPCLNPVCEHYYQRCISTYHTSEHTQKGRPLGKFACDCGYTYCRSGPDHLAEDVFRKDRVLAYGPLWKAKLRELWFDPAIKLKDISSQLGAVITTVNHQARSLGLPVPRTCSHPARLGTHRKRRGSKDIEWYRAHWLTLVKEFPGASTYTLRCKAWGIYAWLRHHDKEWLAAYCPAKEPTKKQSSHVQLASRSPQRAMQREDEVTLDARTAEAVRDAADRLIATLNPPERITLRRISQEVPSVPRLWRQPNIAPLTMQAIQEVTETTEAFALRRLRWAVKQYREEWICPTRTEFIQRAKLRSSLHFPSVQQALEEALVSLSECT